MGAAASHANSPGPVVSRKGGWLGSLLKWAVPVLIVLFLAKWGKKPLKPGAGSIGKKPGAGGKAWVKQQREARKAASAAARGQKRGEQVPRRRRRLSNHDGENDALEKMRREHAQMRRREAESHLARAVSQQEQLQQKLQQERQQGRHQSQQRQEQGQTQTHQGQERPHEPEANDLGTRAREDHRVGWQQSRASGVRATPHVSRHMSVHVQRCCQALAAAGQAQSGGSLREHLMQHNSRCERELPLATLRQAAAVKAEAHPLHPAGATDRFQLFVKKTQSSRNRQLVRSPIEPEPDPEPEPEAAHTLVRSAVADYPDWRVRHSTMTPEERDAAELAEFQAALAQHHAMQTEQERFRKLKARFRELEAAAEARGTEHNDDSSRHRRASAGHINPRSPTSDITVSDAQEISASPRHRRQSAAAVLPSPSRSASARLHANLPSSTQPDEFGLVHHSAQLQQAQVCLSPVSERTEETEESTASGEPERTEHRSRDTAGLSSLGSVLTQRIEEENEE
jgi:hypothetical protein